MTASASTLRAARAAFGALVDYAGLFPPAQLPMADAVREYAQARHGAYAWMLARFIVRASQAAELLEALPSGDRVALCVVLDSGVRGLEAAAQLRRSRRIDVQTLEIALGEDDVDSYASELMRCGLHDVATYCECGVRAMPALKERGFGAKIRCGGAQPGAYPSAAAVAEFLDAACRFGVAFKATAGLHHPVRHFNSEAGVKMHGFLNLIAATAEARAGAACEQIEHAVACEDAAQFRIDAGGFHFGQSRTDAEAMQALRRESFVAYGSCSFSEPVDDLRALRMIE